MQIEIKFICNAYLALLVTWRAEGILVSLYQLTIKCLSSSQLCWQFSHFLYQKALIVQAIRAIFKGFRLPDALYLFKNCVGSKKLNKREKQHIPTAFKTNFCQLGSRLYRQNVLPWVKTKPCIFNGIIFEMFVKIHLHHLPGGSCYCKTQTSNDRNITR